MIKYWIGVASENHVKYGIKGGFCQLCHGKNAPLNRMKEGDWIIYYSPKETLETKVPCQKFTAIGKVLSGVTYQVELYPGFMPYRKNVSYLEHTVPVPLSLISKEPLWQEYRSRLRFGHFEISKALFDILAGMMKP
ncbi:hypothetical protein AMS59_12155 [Lysinibacillus sp. FJAT-14745]|uniref:EVE domain-containing protein n=1 Tax=Lysinibacillus sp. FJAT-14745 TaxID=1704289 RepID=UPI0006ABE083|nr:EVE domain-containing protein [Lysinibacillus sp. FJAT-14745]KOP78582.1 hypothetical protein AMS59_12155 [Lysinibacillus sp. FJAT-14745]